MSLTLATLLPALVLLGLGAVCLVRPPSSERVAQRVIRSNAVALGTLALASAWFLYKVTQWGEADFGEFRHFAFIAFLGIAVLSWFHLRDFLVVRAGAVLYLLIAHALLGAAYMQYDQPGRLVLVTMVYLGIVLALFFGTVPYRFRDGIGWLHAAPLRIRVFGGICTLCGILLLIALLSY